MFGGQAEQMVELRKQTFIAGCKQMVAGKAHNLEVVGSSPTPAIKFIADE